MKKKTLPASPAGLALAVFQPSPNVCYSLETTAHLADVPHRNILVYCRAGLLQPVAQAPYGVMVFTEEAVYTVRRIEHLRTVHGLTLAWIKTLFELTAEVDRLRAEVRFLRNA